MSKTELIKELQEMVALAKEIDKQVDIINKIVEDSKK